MSQENLVLGSARGKGRPSFLISRRLNVILLIGLLPMMSEIDWLEPFDESELLRPSSMSMRDEMSLGQSGPSVSKNLEETSRKSSK